jgi:superfamily II DNA or RNA helicase
MSALVNIDSIPIELRKKMVEDLIVTANGKDEKKAKYNKHISYNTYDIVNDHLVAVPFSYFFRELNSGFPNDKNEALSMKAKFQIELFERQKSIRKESLEILNETRSLLLSLYTGFGKTKYAIYLAYKIGYKTVITCHRSRLILQWVDSIIQACGKETKIQVVKGKAALKPDVDFYIINPVILAKRNRDDFEKIGTVIVDEAHLICTEKYSRALNFLFPKYLIFLTATPIRSDGQDKVLELFVGKNMIYRPLRANFNVYMFSTGFKPAVQKNSAGDLDWNSVLSSQAQDSDRNETIIDLCRYFSRRNILLLCKRKDQARIVHDGLVECGEDSCIFMGSNKFFNIESRIVVSTCSKSGVGFDHPKLDMLILASDVEENFIQYLGRVFRREDHYPIILDLVDSFRPLQNHSESRKKIYQEAGGNICKFQNCFKSFPFWRTQFKRIKN